MAGANVYDTAAYITSKLGALSEYQLQKLVYYAQAWSLVWDEVPLFREKIKGWVDGPVCPELWHRERNGVVGRPETLTVEQRETIDAVLECYRSLTADQLIELSHRETPWLKTRHGLAPSQRGTVLITQQSMRDYYGALVDGSREKKIPDSVRRGIYCLMSVPADRLEALSERRSVDPGKLLSWLRGEQVDPCHDT